MSFTDDLNVETFCQALMERCTQSDAYRRTFNVSNMTDKSVWELSSRYAKKDKVVSRMRELRAEAAEQHKVTRDEVIAELSKLSKFDIRNLYDDDGNLLHPKQLDDITAAGISGMKVTAQKHGRGKNAAVEYIHEYKTTNKDSALDKLGKHFNIYEDHQKAGTGEIHVHFNEQDEKLL